MMNRESECFQLKGKITVKIAAPLKYFRNLTLEMLLINYEINLILTWSTVCIIFAATGAVPFTITDTKHSIPLVTL